MIIAIVGPTAVGKSDLAIDLAERLGAEIVSADSMQVYIGMDIGTAKVPEGERRGVPHHMVDVWSPDHEVSVVDFRDRARAHVMEIESRGRDVVIVATVFAGVGMVAWRVVALLVCRWRARA